MLCVALAGPAAASSELSWYTSYSPLSPLTQAMVLCIPGIFNGSFSKYLFKSIFMSSIEARSQEDKSKGSNIPALGELTSGEERDLQTLGHHSMTGHWQSESESGSQGTNTPSLGCELLLGRPPPVHISVPPPPPRPAISDAHEMLSE